MFNYASSTPTMVPNTATGPMNGTGRLSEFGNVGSYATLTPGTIAANQPLYLSPFCNTAVPQVAPYQNIAPMWNTPVAPVQPGMIPPVGLNTAPFNNPVVNHPLVNPFVNNPFVSNPLINPMLSPSFNCFGTPYAGIPTPYTYPTGGIPFASSLPFVNPLTVHPLNAFATATPFVNPVTGITPYGISPFASMYGTLPYSTIGLNGFAGTYPATPFGHPATIAALTGTIPGAINALTIANSMPFGIQSQVPFGGINPLTTINPWTAQNTIPFGVNPWSTTATLPAPVAGIPGIGVNPVANNVSSAWNVNPWLGGITNPLVNPAHIYGMNPIHSLVNPITSLLNPMAALNSTLAWGGINPLMNPLVNPLATTPWNTIAAACGISPIASMLGGGIESIVPGMNRFGGISPIFGGLGVPNIPGMVPGLFPVPNAGVNTLFGGCCGVC